jgi:hypothetical protein
MMAALLVAMAVMMVAMTAALPAWQTASRREPARIPLSRTTVSVLRARLSALQAQVRPRNPSPCTRRCAEASHPRFS